MGAMATAVAMVTPEAATAEDGSMAAVGETVEAVEMEGEAVTERRAIRSPRLREEVYEL